MDALPEVRQCTDAAHQQFGATATKAGDDRWLVANPRNGGHWAADAEVAGWDPLIPASQVVEQDPAAGQ